MSLRLKFCASVGPVFLLGALALLGSAFSRAEETSELSVKQIMETVITPATDEIWGAGDLSAEGSGTRWKALESAAMRVIAASKQIAKGGAGPQDDAWAADPVWQGFNLAMLQAAEQAAKAAGNRDEKALLDAGDILYPPCEGCHLRFNPGVKGQ